MTELTLQSVVSHTANTPSTEMDGETVLMSIENGGYFALDRIGTEIWSRLEHAISVADLLTAMAERYGCDPDAIENDILDLLRDMAENGLIETRHPI